MQIRAALLNSVAAAAVVLGSLAVQSTAFAEDASAAADIIRPATELPPPIGKRGPETVRVDLSTVEVLGQLADGATYDYWTFNKKVPGPFLRVRVGDTVQVRLKQ